MKQNSQNSNIVEDPNIFDPFVFKNNAKKKKKKKKKEKKKKMKNPILDKHIVLFMNLFM